MKNLEDEIAEIETRLNDLKQKKATQEAADHQIHIIKLADLVREIECTIALAEAYASKHNLQFYISPAYGMGGTYDPNDGWQSSSQGC